MPLVHSKSDKAFSENVSREMHAGKPQKQAVAIAYSVKRHAQHKKMGHGGQVEDCAECGAPGQYSKGGEVRKFPKRFKDDEDKKEIESHDSPASHEMPGRLTSEEDKEELEAGDFPSQGPAIMEGEEHFAEGGEAGEDDDLMAHCAGELCDALERKDKGAILESLRAIMLSMKEGE